MSSVNWEYSSIGSGVQTSKEKEKGYHYRSSSMFTLHNDITQNDTIP